MKSIISSGDTVKIVGIVADYHHQGLQKAIDPMIFRLTPNSRDAYSIKSSNQQICRQQLLPLKKYGINIFLQIRLIIFSLMNILISNIKQTAIWKSIWTVCISCHTDCMFWIVGLICL